MKNTLIFGGSLCLYVAGAVHDGGASAGSCALGVLGGALYLQLLYRHVDGMGGGVLGSGGGAAAVRTLSAKLGRPGAPNLLVQAADVYTNALAHPQLLVPVAMAAEVAAWPGCQPTFMLLGFVSYKAAVLDAAYKALKAVTVYAAPDSGRPVLPELPTLEDLEAAQAGGDEVAQQPRGSDAGRTLSAFALAAALSLGVAQPAAAACLSECTKACKEIAPGSPQYCADQCALACAPPAANEVVAETQEKEDA